MSRHPATTARQWWAVLLGVMFVCLAWGASDVRAQDAQWRERRTTNFAILYPDGSDPRAAQYAQFVDGVYEEVSAIFNYRTPPPVVLRIYPTMELYMRINPLAAQIPGVVAHANTGRREISIALPQTDGQSQDQIVNNVRHELTHIIAADLSGDKLTTAFQEGIAQFIEHPSTELDTKMQLMQQVIAASRVLPWRDLNQPGVAYSDPRIGYPESYTIVAFLIQRNGFATFKNFVEQIKSNTGYRGALEAAYSVSADQLEQEWRAQLDAFVMGAYRNRAAGAFDLTQAEALVARGDYATAVTQLEAALSTLDRTSQSDLTRQTEQLLKRAKDGQRAQQLATEARTALERGDYAAAQKAATDGGALLNELGQPAQLKVMREYGKLATDGAAAQQQLGQARAALRTLRIGTAQSLLVEAYRTFTRLGDEQGAAAAAGSLRTIQQAERIVAVGCVIVAALILAWNVRRRAAARQDALPFG